MARNSIATLGKNAACTKIVAQEEARRWYQDGAYRKAHNDAPKCSLKMAVFITLTLIAIIVAVIVYPMIKKTDFYTKVDDYFKRKSDDRPKPIAICLRNKTKAMEPIVIDTSDRLNLKYSYFPGLFNITQAYQMCHDPDDVYGGIPNVYSKALDSSLTRFVSKHKEVIFTQDKDLPIAMRYLVWTGGYIDLEFDEGLMIRWFGAKDIVDEWYKNFCEPGKSKVWQSVETLADYWRKERKGIPIIHLVKDFSKTPNGCWRLFDNVLYDWRELKFHLVCQTTAERMTFKRVALEVRKDFATTYKTEFHGKLRPEEDNPYISTARRYALFGGRGNYEDAQERCGRLQPGASMISPNTLPQDYDINKIVEYYSNDIFGIDNGDPSRRTLIWTGGYYNLTSKYPTTLRWANDPEAILDLPPSPKTETMAFMEYKRFEYENFCAPVETYEEMVQEAVKERSTTSEGCLKGGLMVLVKDYRIGQSNQGCWHLYDLDYLIEHKYEFYLVCELPGRAIDSSDIRQEHEAIFNYNQNSGEP